MTLNLSNVFYFKPQEQLPFTVSRISVVGAAGQGTTIKGYRELDLAVFVKGKMLDNYCNSFRGNSRFSTNNKCGNPYLYSYRKDLVL